MKKLSLICTLALILGFSGNSYAQGGFTGPSVSKKITVKEALELKDDSSVILEGKIKVSLGDEKYQFSDGTADIVIEIDNEDWRGLSVNENDTVEIKGEVDKEFLNTKIDVDTITKK